MRDDSSTEGSTLVVQGCYRGISLGLACSIALSSGVIPALANGYNAAPAWHPAPYLSQQSAAFNHSQVQHFTQHSPTPPSLPHSLSVNLSHALAHSHVLTGLTSLTSPAPGIHDLNLASTQANILASHLAGLSSLTIMVGNTKQVVSLDSKLTGGEAIAALQVISGGKQTIKLAADGRAIGGAVVLNSSMFAAVDSALGGSINSLTVAHGVKLIDSLGVLTLSGSLNNQGSILTASSTAHASDIISATMISNAAGALIGSYTGSSASGLFAADPMLNAATSVSNSGTISSAGSLTINAPSVYNTGGSSAPFITAHQNININAQSLTNAGLIAALTGNVNVVSTSSLSLLTNGGTIKALDGNINLTTNNAALIAAGGDLLSQQVNLKAQAGSIDLSANNVTGIINASGDSVHVTTVSSQKLGNIDTSGDPQFVSTSGNITIDGAITPTNGADLALIAGGNILSGLNGALNTSTTPSGNGGNLTLIAGAKVAGDDTVATVTDSTNAGKGSTTGGIIDLTGGNGGTGAIKQITTAGTGSAGNAGYIEMVAYAGSAKDSGIIKVPTTVTINAAGSGSGSNGDVTLIAGATNGTAISSGAITGNQVTLLTQTPSANSGQASGVVFTGGTSNLGIGGFTGIANTSTATISVGTTIAAQDLTIASGGNLGSATSPIKFEANQLAVSSTGKSASAYLTDLTGTALNIAAVNIGQTGTFSLNAAANKTTGATGGVVTIAGPISAGTVNLSATGSTSSVDSQNVISANKVTISTTGALTSSGAGNIKAATTSLTAASISAITDVGSLSATAKTGSITITQGASALNLTTKITAAGSNSLLVTSLNQITLKSPITLGALGTVTLDDQAATGGVTLVRSIKAGTVNLIGGNGGVQEAANAIVSAGVISITSAGDIGSSSSAFRVNNNLALGLGNALTVKAGTGHSIFVKDLGTSDVTLDAGSVTSGKSFIFSAAESALNVLEAPFDNVKITDTNALGVVTLNANSNLGAIFGTGLGFFNVTANSDISMNFSNAGIKATSVSLVSNKGNIGQTGDLVATTPNFFIQSKKGNASVTDAASGNITVTGGAPAAFNFISTGNNANILIDSTIRAANILVRAQGSNSNITNAFALGKVANDSGTSISLTPTGNLNINGKLTADFMILGGNKFTGDPILLGTVNINKSLVSDHAINCFVDQSQGININATVKANAMRFVTSTVGANINIKASLTGVADKEGDSTIVTIQANNANVLTTAGRVVSASDINVTGINIGSAAIPLATTTGFMNLLVNGGAAYINNSGNITLLSNGPVTANTIVFNNKGNLSFDGSITANALNISATGSLTVGQQFEFPLSSLAGNNSLTLSAPGGVTDFATLGGPNITINTSSLLVSGVNLAAPGNLTVSNKSGNLFVDGVISGDTVALNSSSALTIGTSQDSPQSSVTGTSALNITGSNSIKNFAILTGASVSATTAAFTNNATGSLGATSSLSIGNPRGNLTIAGPGASIITPTGGSLALTARGTILAGTGSNNVLSDISAGKLHTLTIKAGGNFTGPFFNFSVAPDGKGNGGIISITAANLLYNGPPLPPISFNLTANGSTASGGEVILKLSNTPGGVVIGNGINDYNIDASGTNGGTVQVLTSGNLTVNLNSLKVNAAANGTGSNVTLIAGKNLLIMGNLDTHSGALGTYGKVVLQSNAPTPFTIGGAADTLNGVIGLTSGFGQGVLGSSVTITNNAGVTVNPGFIVSGQGAGITVNTKQLVNNGQVDTPGTLTISNAGSVIVPSGTTGTYAANMLGYAVISTGGNVTINAPLPVVSDLQLSAAKGSLTLPTGVSSLTATTISGDGGTIGITAKSITSPLMSIDAAASTASGAGGTINFVITGTTPLDISSGLTFNVAKGATSLLGGSLTISNGGNLTVDASSLTLGPVGAGAAGANLTLQAGTRGTGTLLVSNTASFANHVVNSLVLQSNSAKAFTLGGASNTNGIIDDGVSLSAQTISIQNSAGAIVQGSGGALTANAAGVAGAIDLVAGKNGIGLSDGAPLVISGANLAVNTTGSAYVSNSQSVSLDAISTGKVFDYSSSADITAAAALVAPTLVLNVAGIIPIIQSNLSTSLSVTASTGAVSINDSLPGLVTVNALSSAGTVSLTSGGAITVPAGANVGGANITLSAGGNAGNIVIGASISSSGTINLSASGKGTITESGSATEVDAGTLILVTQGGNLGTSHTAPFAVGAGILSANTGLTGSAFLQNNAFTTTLTASTVGNTFDYSGNITGASGPVSAQVLTLALGNMTAAVVTNATIIQASTASGDLNVNDSQTGFITLNALSASLGQINITSAGAITTAGSISGAAGVALTAGGAAGSITIGNAINGQSATVSLQATGLGAITTKSGTVSGGIVDLTTQGANIGSTAKAVATNAGSIAINTGTTGDVYLVNTDSQSGGTVSLGAVNVGSLKLTDTNTSAKNSGSLTLNNITASTGAITISTNEQSLNVATGSTISTTNGNITLQNTFAASALASPLISVDDNSTLHASAVVPSNMAAGNVFIVLGAVPASSALQAGVIPSGGPTINTSGIGAVTFGTTSNPNGSITAVASDTLNGLDRTLAFNTGVNGPSQIVLGNNVVITADPPVSAAAVGVAAKSLSLGLGQNRVHIALPISASDTEPNSVRVPLPTARPFSASDTETNSVRVPAPTARPFSASDTETNSVRVPQPRPSGLKGTISNVVRQTMDNGATLIAPAQNTIIDTPFGSVSIAKDSVAMVIAVKDGLTVYDLHDTRSNAVTISCGPGEKNNGNNNGNNISLSPGRSATITTNGVTQFEHINPAQAVAYRRMVSRPVNDRLKVFQGEFEILSMIRSLNPMRGMLASNDSSMRKTASHMIKTAAILSQLGAGEPYRPFATAGDLALNR